MGAEVGAEVGVAVCTKGHPSCACACNVWLAKKAAYAMLVQVCSMDASLSRGITTWVLKDW